MFSGTKPWKKKNTETDDGPESESIFKKNRAADIEACPTDEGQKTSAQEPENDFFHCAPPHYAITKERDHQAVWWNKQADLRSQVIYPTRKEEINFESGTRLDKGADGVTDIGRQILGVADN